MENIDEHQCLECGEWFETLNNYSLCDECEEAIQKEKREIEETQNSLNKQFR